MLDVLTSDVSAGGTLFHTAKSMAVGTRVELRLILASKKLEELTGAKGLLRVAGTVVRSSAEGTVICFDGEPEIAPMAVS